MSITSSTPVQNTPAQKQPSSSLFLDLLALSHIFNGVASALAAGIGYLATVWYIKSPIDPVAFLSAMLATLCLSNAGFVINDILDIDIDRINRPDRPLAAGRVPLWLAWTLYAAYTLIGITLAWAINPATGAVGVIIALVLFLYSYDLKKRFLFGHVVIGLSGALLLPFGGFAAGSTLLLITIPVIFAAFFAREVLKTIPDAEGDRAHGVENITTRFGANTARRVGQIMLAICAVALPLLRLFWALNNWYLAAVALVIWPLMAYSLLRLQNLDAENKNVTAILRVSKLLFLLVAIAILIGSL
ncbi:MAG: UbiA family prenyltransferase [Chloroflexota bacterium]